MSGTASNSWQNAPYPSNASVMTGSIGTSSTAAIALGSGGGRYSFTAFTTNMFIRFGDSTVSAAAATTGNFGLEVPAGQSRTVYVPDSVTHVRAISDTAGPGSLAFGKVGN